MPLNVVSKLHYLVFKRCRVVVLRYRDVSKICFKPSLAIIVIQKILLFGVDCCGKMRFSLTNALL